MKSTINVSNRRRARIGLVSFLVALPIMALQFLPGPAMTNPPIVPERTIEANLHVPARVSGMLRAACANCHSNETKWPWYARVAPLSWAIANDVNSARSVLNLSEWSSGPVVEPGMSVPWLTMACADVQVDRMPLPRYRLLHPEARLSEQEKAMFCAWTRLEIARLRSQERHAAERFERASSSR